MDDKNNGTQGEGNESLETPSTIVENELQNQPSQPQSPQQPAEVTPTPLENKPINDQPRPPRQRPKWIDRIFERFDIYITLFVVLVFAAGFVIFYSYQKSNDNPEKPASIKSSSALDESVLDKLRQTNVTVGDPSQVLSVEANSVFAGSVLVRGDFEVAGRIKIGGPIDVSNINASGNGTFKNLQASGLTISGNSQLQGNTTVGGNLSVSGSGNFGGSLTAASLNIKKLEIGGDITLNRHIDAGGANPSKSNGGALGSGGTTSLSGTDTAGTLNINTGNSPGAGCFARINFTQGFNSTPHIVITPVGSSASSIKYYISRSSSGFSICTSSAPPAGKSFAFDFVAID